MTKVMHPQFITMYKYNLTDNSSFIMPLHFEHERPQAVSYGFWTMLPCNARQNSAQIK